MTNPEILEQEAERLNISASTERCLGNCATCAYARNCATREREMALDDEGILGSELEQSMSDMTEASLRRLSPEESLKIIKRQLDNNEINEVFALYLKELKPLHVTPQSNYDDKRNHFQIPA